MRFLLQFTSLLLLVVSCLPSVAHATEGTGNGSVSLIELATCHSTGDADEVPADSDGSYPHHHSICHGHDLAAPAKVIGTLSTGRIDSTMRVMREPMLTDRTLEAPHRPPIA